MSTTWSAQGDDTEITSDDKFCGLDETGSNKTFPVSLLESFVHSLHWNFKTVSSGSTDTIEANETIKVQTDIGGITLDSNLASGEAAEIIDGAGSLDDNSLTINGNGDNILLSDGSTESSITVSIPNCRILLYHNGTNIVVISAHLALEDKKDIKVSENDTVAGFLFEKLVAGNGILDIVEKNDDGDESVEIQGNNIKAFEISEQNDKLIITLQDGSTHSVPITQSENNTELVTKEYFEANVGGDSKTGFIFTGEYDPTKDYYNNSARRDIASFNNQNYQYLGEDQSNEGSPSDTFAGCLLLDANTGINTLQVSDPSAPEQIFQEGQSRSNIDDIEIVNDYAVVLNDNSVMTVSQNSVIDGKNGKQIIDSKGLGTDLDNEQLDSQGNYIYTLAAMQLSGDVYQNIITIYEVASDGTLTQVQQYQTDYDMQASDIIVTTSYIIIVWEDYSELEIWNNTTDSTPMKAGKIDKKAVDIAIDETNSYLFVLQSDNLLTYDISTVSSPSQVASSGTPSSGQAIIRNGDYLYQADANILYIYDISTRTSFNGVGSITVATISTTDSIQNLDYANDYIYYTAQEYFQIIDVSTKSDPQAVVGSKKSIGGDTRGIIFDSDYIQKWWTYDGTIDSYSSNVSLGGLQQREILGQNHDLIGNSFYLAGQEQQLNRWSLTSLSQYDSGYISDQGPEMYCNEGKILYHVEKANDVIEKYSLSDAYKPSTKTLQQTLDLTTLSNYNSNWILQGIVVKQDGTKIMMIGSNFGDLYEFAFGTANDLNTLSVNNTFDLSNEFYYYGGKGYGIAVSPESNNIFFAGRDSEKGDIRTIFTLNLNDVWDLTTVTGNDGKYKMPDIYNPIRSLDIKPDGTKLYVAMEKDPSVYDYNVEAYSIYDYTISTATLDVEVKLGDMSTLFSIKFYDDGKYVQYTDYEDTYTYFAGGMTDPQIQVYSDYNNLDRVKIFVEEGDCSLICNSTNIKDISNSTSTQLQIANKSYIEMIFVNGVWRIVNKEANLTWA